MVATADRIEQRVEALGPAERIVQTLTCFTDHIVHNRPGVTVPRPDTPLGCWWWPATTKKLDNHDVQVYRLDAKCRVLIGLLRGDDVIGDGVATAKYRPAGLFPEAVTYLYRQIAEVWRMDQEFCARWASWTYARDHRDLKVMLAAFMLVQNRVGDAVVEDGEVLFFDHDYREVGEAMALLRDDKALSPKLLVRLGDVLELPEIATINRELGFGRSQRHAALGRYRKLVNKWLRYRERNEPMLQGLVRAGYRRTVMRLCQRCRYQPESPRFFEILRWKQKQASDGRRSMAIGVAVTAAESWAGMTEQDICQTILDTKPNYKRLVGLLPRTIGLTRAIVAAALEAGSFSDADMVLMTPTFEDLGLLNIDRFKATWTAAIQRVDNQRAANVARNVKSKETKEALQDAADVVAAKAIAEVAHDIRIYCCVDKSGSMEGAIDRAQQYLTRFLGAFPLDRLHCSVFNTVGSEITIAAPKAAAVAHAFEGHHAGGGTSYAAGVRALCHHAPKPDEDVVVLFVGDQGDNNAPALAREARQLNPTAFALLRVVSPNWGEGRVVVEAARQLNIPCFEVNEQMFETTDPYAVQRVIRDLIASTPVNRMAAAPRRVSLVEQILKTELLRKPAWA
jgi:hypothetical protein